MSERLEILRPILSQFKRRFSVFSLGSGIESGIEQEIANEFDCTVICAEKDPLRYTPQGRMIVLQREFSAEDLDTLSKCEHFDVVLAMNVLHWTNGEWSDYLMFLRRMSSYVVVQTPMSNDTQACGEFNKEIQSYCSYRMKILGESVQFDGHMPRPIYWMRGIHGTMTAKTFGSPDGEIEAQVTEDGFIDLRHKKEFQRFIPGLTLTNYKLLNGVYPPREAIVSALREMKWDGKHRDIQPWNIRFTGQECYLIDPGGSDWPDSDEENLEAVIQWVNQ